MRHDGIMSISEYRSPESLRNHPRMKREDRAKIFSPFAALRGYEENIEEEKRKSSLERRPVISDGEKERMDSALCALEPGASLRISAFREEADGRGTAYEVCGTFLKASTDSDELMIMAGGKAISIRFCDIIRIQTA